MMDEFKQKWDKEYPHLARGWRDNWDEFTTHFRHPSEMRKLIHTTNIIESVNSKFRKAMNRKGAGATLRVSFLKFSERGLRYGRIYAVLWTLSPSSINYKAVHMQILL